MLNARTVELPAPQTDPRRSSAFCFALAILICLPLTLAANGNAAAGAAAMAKAQRIQDVVDDVRAELGLPREVTVAIVPQNPLMVSVESPKNYDGAYRVAFEDAFVDALSDDDLRAVVAHELGHVWIFTHHPYLQTEALANQIAMRVVSRESLEKVYDKVWGRGAKRGTLARFSIH
jgi:Zn-dependent peptidase ImmA (M78 family)